MKELKLELSESLTHKKASDFCVGESVKWIIESAFSIEPCSYDGVVKKVYNESLVLDIPSLGITVPVNSGQLTEVKKVSKQFKLDLFEALDEDIEDEFNDYETELDDTIEPVEEVDIPETIEDTNKVVSDDIPATIEETNNEPIVDVPNEVPNEEQIVDDVNADIEEPTIEETKETEDKKKFFFEVFDYDSVSHYIGGYNLEALDNFYTKLSQLADNEEQLDIAAPQLELEKYLSETYLEAHGFFNILENEISIMRILGTTTINFTTVYQYVDGENTMYKIGNTIVF